MLLIFSRLLFDFNIFLSGKIEPQVLSHMVRVDPYVNIQQLEIENFSAKLCASP